jgi:hypothetical protein
MSDRCVANKAALRRLDNVWGKTLNKLFCHLHPLDTIAASCRKELKKSEKGEKGACFGSDCQASNIILAVST